MRKLVTSNYADLVCEIQLLPISKDLIVVTLPEQIQDLL